MNRPKTGDRTAETGLIKFENDSVIGSEVEVVEDVIHDVQDQERLREEGEIIQVDNKSEYSDNSEKRESAQKDISDINENGDVLDSQNIKISEDLRLSSNADSYKETSNKLKKKTSNEDIQIFKRSSTTNPNMDSCVDRLSSEHDDSEVIQFDEKGERVGYLPSSKAKFIRQQSLQSIEHSDHFYKQEISHDKKFVEIHHHDILKKIKKKKYLVTFFYRIKKSYFHHLDDDFKSKNFLSKIWYFVVNLPLTLLRDLTIPPCEDQDWKQTLFSLIPIFSTLFIILVFKCKFLILISLFLA